MGLFSPSSNFAELEGTNAEDNVVDSRRLRLILSPLTSTLSDATLFLPNPEAPTYALSSSAFLRVLFLEREPPKLVGITENVPRKMPPQIESLYNSYSSQHQSTFWNPENKCQRLATFSG